MRSPVRHHRQHLHSHLATPARTAATWHIRILALLFVLLPLFTLLLPVQAGATEGGESGAGEPPLPLSGDVDGPLVIIFDVSGSMNEDDVSGTNKLGAAKTSMTSMLREHSSSNGLGLWTYPGGMSDQEGCAVGNWMDGLSPDMDPDATEVDAHIRALTAEGETPTGPAIRAVVDRLEALGHTSATLLLVSDGESNCGVPPCDVATEIVASGFDLRIPTVGFDISESGRGELGCIAEATGAGYHEAEDASSLIDELAQYHARDLELSVAAPTRILSGATVQLTATITNPSNQRITGLTAVVAMEAGPSRDIFPTLLSPQRRLPAIGAGETLTTTWTASSATGSTGTARWRVLVGSRGTGSVLQSGEIGVSRSGLTIQDAGPLLKELSGPVVVMGDSYSSGEGAGTYTHSSGKCHRSELAYGPLIGGRSTTIIACSGATSDHVLRSPQNDTESPQVEALDQLTTPPGLVFLTIGGNDIGFGQIVAECVKSDCASNDAVMRRKLADISERGPSLEKTYLSVLEHLNSHSDVRARKGRVAPLVVSPYPDLLWSRNQRWCGTTHLGFSPQEVAYGRALVAALNEQARRTVADLSERGYPIYFADDVVDFPQPNHTLCDTDSFFVRIDAGSIAGHLWSMQELAHPNPAGYRAWADSLVLWSQTSRAAVVNTTMPNDSRGWRDHLADLFDTWSQHVTAGTHHPVRGEIGAFTQDGSTPPGSVAAEITVRGGDTVDITVTGLAPGSTVTVTVHSAPRSLGTLTADDRGTVSGPITVPTDLESGRHDVILEGLDADATSAAFEVPVLLHSSGGWVWWGTLGIGAALLVLGVTSVVVGLRRRSRSRMP